MKTSIITLTALLIAFSGMASAQDVAAETQPKPGFISAGIPVLSPVDRTIDNAMADLGVTSQEDVVMERASEAVVAFKKGNTKTGAKMVNITNKVAKAASNTNSTGLDNALSVLNRVKDQVPEQAQAGITEAISNIEEAKKRIPENAGKQDGKTGERPESGMGNRP